MAGIKKPGVKGALAKGKKSSVVIRRGSSKVYGVFIDGTSLDRASRRMQRRVDMSALLKSLTSGAEPILARYYTLLPAEDDSRHHSFLEAVAKAGFEIVLKRLPPKGINRQVAIDVEMGADITSFALGRDDISEVSLVSSSGQFSIMPKIDPQQSRAHPIRTPISPHPALSVTEIADLDASHQEQDEATPLALTTFQEVEEQKRVVVVVCPSRELAYPLTLCKHFGADTVSADFGKFTTGDLLKSAAKWIDLSDSQTIWK